MILTYKQCLNEFGSDYHIKRKLFSGALIKLAPGYYSETKSNSEIELISSRYSNAIFTLNSAFYYHGLTDTIPELYYLATDRDASKISNHSIKQIFVSKEIFNIGVETITVNSTKIKVYNKERMLVELVRNKNKFPYEYYKEIIGNYRNIIHKLDIQSIEEYASKFPKKNLIIKRIEEEVF